MKILSAILLFNKSIHITIYFIPPQIMPGMANWTRKESSLLPALKETQGLASSVTDENQIQRMFCQITR